MRVREKERKREIRFPSTMEIQSGNGEEVAAALATRGSVSQSAPEWLQVEATDEEPQGGRRIERFHVRLDSLKRIFEQSAVSDAATCLFSLPPSLLCLLEPPSLLPPPPLHASSFSPNKLCSSLTLKVCSQRSTFYILVRKMETGPTS